MHRMTVSDLMSTDVITLDYGDDLDVAEQAMRAGKCHHLPVVEDGHLVGMVAHSDLLRAQVSVFAEISADEDRALKRSIRASEVMSRNVKTVGPNTLAREAATILETQNYGSLPVVADGRLVGILTERDFLHLVVRALSEDDASAPVAQV